MQLDDDSNEVWFGLAEAEGVELEDCITSHIWTEICFWVVQWVVAEFLCLPELSLSNANSSNSEGVEEM